MGIITIAGGNCQFSLHFLVPRPYSFPVLVLLHLWNLWDRNPRLITWTLVLFVVTQAANVGCAIKIVMSIHSKLSCQAPGRGIRN